MHAYIARQAIFNIRKEVYAYELLYRDGANGNTAVFTDGDQATRGVLSDAVTLFGLSKLTNNRIAYVNFTQNLIMSDFVYLARPEEVVVELLEDIDVNAEVLEKLKNLRRAGYTLALDDYTGSPEFDPLLPLVSIVKVDFRLTDRRLQRKLAKKLKMLSVTLLAEKVETKEDFQEAQNMGYSLFQGYFFEKPRLFTKRVPTLASSTYGRILNELHQKEVDFRRCAQIIHTDASMTYMLMQKVQSLNYYRGNMVTGIQRALVMMGIEELRRFTILMLARKNNITYSDELVRQAYRRGIFIERLMESVPEAPPSEQGFLMGMFSLLDRILGMPMREILQDLNVEEQMKTALLDLEGKSVYTPFLQYVILYEMANPRLRLPDLELPLDEEGVTLLYMKCMRETDRVFTEFGENYETKSDMGAGPGVNDVDGGGVR